MKQRADTLEEAYLRRVVKRDGECWGWNGAISSGYGHFAFQGKWWRAHRVSYMLYVGPIPDDLVPDHLCRVRSCSNPEHLELVTMTENIRRGIALDRVTQCRRGHDLTIENSVVYTCEGTRYCRACDNERQRRRYALRRQGAVVGAGAGG